jgi:hypothetical protein
MINAKYLPTKGEQVAFIKNRIDEYKRQVLGGQLEIAMAKKNGEKRAVVTTQDMIDQIINNIDVLESELDKLQED